MRILNNLDGSSKAHWEGVKMEWEGRKYCLVELVRCFNFGKGLCFIIVVNTSYILFEH